MDGGNGQAEFFPGLHKALLVKHRHHAVFFRPALHGIGHSPNIFLEHVQLRVDLQGLLVVHQGIVVFAVGFPEQGRQVEGPGILEAGFDLPGHRIDALEIAIELAQVHVVFFRRFLRLGNFLVALVRGHPLFQGRTAQLHGGAGGIVGIPVIQGLVGMGEDALVVRRHIAAGIVVGNQ